jgi:hypothetical protein
MICSGQVWDRRRAEIGRWIFAADAKDSAASDLAAHGADRFTHP